jgi:hypothetical protein
MKTIILLVSIIFLSISSKAWTQDCPGSPKVSGNTSGWNNCWGNFTHSRQNFKGDRIVGWFLNSEMNKGTYEFNARAHGINTGTIYIGEFNNKAQRYGQGIMYYALGDVYDGSWINNEESGFGTYYFFSGANTNDVYRGNFKNHMKSGFGTYYWSNGEIYIGQFSNDLANGRGTLFKNDGTIWSGVMNNWNWDTVNEVTNNYRGKMPDLKPYFDTYKYDKKDHQKYNLAKQNNNNNNSNSSVTKSNKTNFDSAKKQCEEIGFKKGTEKFGECVLDLTE